MCYAALDSCLDHNLGLQIEKTELSLCRQYLEEDWVCLGELQDPPMAEEVAAAHSSTQQPVSVRDKRLILTQAAIDRCY